MNPHPLHWKAKSQSLDSQGSPCHFVLIGRLVNTKSLSCLGHFGTNILKTPSIPEKPALYFSTLLSLAWDASKGFLAILFPIVPPAPAALWMLVHWILPGDSSRVGKMWGMAAVMIRITGHSRHILCPPRVLPSRRHLTDSHMAGSGHLTPKAMAWALLLLSGTPEDSEQESGGRQHPTSVCPCRPSQGLGFAKVEAGPPHRGP